MENKNKQSKKTKKNVLNKENSNNDFSGSKLNSFALLLLGFKKNESAQNDGNRDISNNSGTRRIGE